MDDIISGAADFFKEAVELLAEHPRETAEVTVALSVFAAGYYMGRYDESKSNDDKNYLPVTN